MKKQCLLSLLLCTTVLSGCATHSNSTAISIERKLVPVLSGTPLSIDLNANYLPPEYKGDNLDELINKFEKISIKDEYETTSSHISRLQNAVDNNIYAFMREIEFKLIEYNADSQILSISFIPTFTNSKEHLLYFLISSKLKNTGNYTGENAYGVSRDVKEYNEEETALLVNSSINKEAATSINITNIKPEEARKVGGLNYMNMGIMYICKIHNPSGLDKIAFEDSDFLKATITRPSEYTITRHFLNVDLYQVWVFDKTSGKVLTKQNIN